MKAYLPKIQVRLVKVIRRDRVTADLAASMSRYQQNDGFELTELLGELGGVRLVKSVHEPAGGFSITLADQPLAKHMESVYALVEPMDMIEIRMAHDPSDYAKPNEGYSLPIVMRGLVSSVTRNETMQGGKPMRSVTISGQDFGKILEIIQIFYLNNSAVGDNILSELAFFQKYSSKDEAKIKPASQFVLDMVKGVMWPYLARMLAASKSEEVGAQPISSLGVQASIMGSISPYTVASMNNVSLYRMMSTLLDVGPFNELFVRDDADHVTLVARPAPLRTPAGAWIQTAADGTPATAEFVDITSADVIALNLSRSDAGVANYYWASNTRWTLMHNETAKSLAMTGPGGDYVMFDYPNSNASFYGVRKMEIDVALGHPAYANSDGAGMSKQPIETGKIGNWLHRQRTMLAEINKDNVIFEYGSMRLRGNEKIKAGMYLRLTRGVGEVVSEFYVTRVDHDFQPFAGFFTTVTVERGTSFASRAAAAVPVYLGEIDAGGVS
jgi:hypothetical protein